MKRLPITFGILSAALAVMTVALAQVSRYGYLMAIASGLCGLAAGLFGDRR